MVLSAATNTTVAATAAKAATIGDSGSTRTVYAIVVVLVLVSIGLTVFTTMFWQRTRPTSTGRRPAERTGSSPRQRPMASAAADRREALPPRPRAVSVLDDDTTWEPDPWVPDASQPQQAPPDRYSGVRTSPRPAPRPAAPRPTGSRPPGEPLL
jgi:hypothetical protein